MLSLLVMIANVSAFNLRQKVPFTGTYGVSSEDHSQIVLKVNPDHTYYYQDYSIVNGPQVFTGNWVQKGNTIILQHAQAQRNFHHVWTFHTNGQVAKSRKRLTFYRLCKLA